MQSLAKAVPHDQTRRRTKFVELQEIAAICDDARSHGRTIVHCHGVFDLLHVGHLRHFAAAKRYGDLLVVSITTDEHVNKGPDRPAFPTELRAEMLQALEPVDWVTFVAGPSAEPAIEAIRPDVYVKGGEYDQPSKDITGKITHEQALVERCGGRIEFTYDITFSSSNLLNSRFQILDEPARVYLERLRDAGGEALIADYLAKIEQLKVVIVGETIVDHYCYVSPIGKSAKENIIATLHRDEEHFAGGVIAAANHLAALCPASQVVTILGDPAAGENFEDLVRQRYALEGEPMIIYRPGGPTVQKTRFVEPTYVHKLFELYRMDDSPLPPAVRDRFHESLTECISQADAVIVCDFGHGLINSETVQILQQHSKFLAVNAQTNAGNIGYNLATKYRQADLLCIDAMEARLAAQDKHCTLEEIAGEVLPDLVDCPNIIVTHGKSGCYTSGGTKGEVFHIPAFRRNVVDTVGAGDAFFVIAAPFVAAGAPCDLAGFVGNVAGAMKVGVLGHRESITRLQFHRYLKTLLK